MKDLKDQLIEKQKELIELLEAPQYFEVIKAKLFKRKEITDLETKIEQGVYNVLKYFDDEFNCIEEKGLTHAEAHKRAQELNIMSPCTYIEYIVRKDE